MDEFAVGAGFSAEELLLLIAGTVVAITLVWTAWVTWGQFEAFVAQRAHLPALSWIVLRAVVLLLLILLFVRA